MTSTHASCSYPLTSHSHACGDQNVMSNQPPLLSKQSPECAVIKFSHSLSPCSYHPDFILVSVPPTCIMIISAVSWIKQWRSSGTAHNSRPRQATHTLQPMGCSSSWYAFLPLSFLQSGSMPGIHQPHFSVSSLQPWAFTESSTFCLMSTSNCNLKTCLSVTLQMSHSLSLSCF